MPAPNVLGSGANTFRYTLSVSGNDYTRKIPLDNPVRITLGGPGGSSQMQWTVEDTAGNLAFPAGARVTLRDNNSITTSGVARSGLAFTGVLLNTRDRDRSGGGLFWDCTAVGAEWFAQNSFIPSWKSRANTAGTNRLIANDDKLVVALLAAGDLGLKNLANVDTASIQQTNTNMPAVNVSNQSLAAALDQVADLAEPQSGSTLRRWYIDDHGGLHYYSGAEGLVPPFRIADSSYVAQINAASGMAAFWAGRVRTSSTIVDEQNTAALTMNGGYTLGVQSLCLNELQIPAVTLNGSSGYGTATNAAHHPGDTWTVGIVFNRARTSARKASGCSWNVLALMYRLTLRGNCMT